MRPEFLAGAIGTGMNSFMDGYLQAQEITRKKAESDEAAALRREEAKRKEKSDRVGLLNNALTSLPEDQRSGSYASALRRKQAEEVGVPYEDSPPQGKPMWQQKLDYQDGLIRGRDQGRAKTGVQLPAGEVSKLAEGDSMTGLMTSLSENIEKSADLMGPIRGRVSGHNPYNTRGQVFDADMKIAAQKIGTFLEGGKMTDKDVPKYRAMLPNIWDTPDVARGKLANVAKLLRDKQAGEVDSFKRAGFKVDNFQKPGTGLVPQQAQPQAPQQNLKGAYKPGTMLTLKNGQRVRVGSDGDTLEPVQ